MRKQTVLLAGMAIFVAYDHRATVSAQENDGNAPAAKSSSDQIPTPDAAKPANEPKANADFADEIVVTGIVLKPDLSHATHATIRSAAPVPDQLESRLGRTLIPKMYEATADEEGRFSITINKAPYGNPADLIPAGKNSGRRRPSWLR